MNNEMNENILTDRDCGKSVINIKENTLQNEIGDDKLRTLIEKALDMRNYSYTPYSNFNVGAALLCSDGTVYGGCNIENAAYGPSVCAERTAIFKAVSEGKKSFTAIVVAGGPREGIKDFCPPCGVCRQVMVEFCDPDFKVILAKSVDEYRVFTLGELMPESFSVSQL